MNILNYCAYADHHIQRGGVSLRTRLRIVSIKLLNSHVKNPTPDAGGVSFRRESERAATGTDSQSFSKSV
jgi:hypothetical protein